jgi:hypothetical protein
MGSEDCIQAFDIDGIAFVGAVQSRSCQYNLDPTAGFEHGVSGILNELINLTAPVSALGGGALDIGVFLY